MVKTAALSIRIDPEVREALDKAARREDRSVTSYVERALRRQLEMAGFLKPKKD